MTNQIEIDEKKRYFGTIIHVDVKKGYFFVVSKELPFTRIFAHWSALIPTTLHFSKLHKGMKAWFSVINYIDKETGANKGLRAIKVDVEQESNHEVVSNSNSTEN